MNSLLAYAYLFESTYDDTHLMAGPLYHAAPFGWAAFSFLLGNPLVVMPRFDSEEFLRLVQVHRITTTFMVPTMLNMILHLSNEKKARYDISSLRVITVAGESFPYTLKQRAVEFFRQGGIFEYYASTETGLVTYIRPEDQLRKKGSCGKAAPGNDILLFDENKKKVPLRETGILYVKSLFLLDGY